MNIIIGGDLVPTRLNEGAFSEGRIEGIVGDELNQVLSGADYRIFNCEIPLTDADKPIPKFGPNLKASPSCISGFKAIKVDLLTLANNHINDFGTDGLNETIQVISDNGIAWAGVGQNAAEASRPFIFTMDQKIVGVFCCTEHEFSVASENSAGANAFDALYSLEQIRSLKTGCDYLIVLYHGGRELYPFPTPNLQVRCRRMVDYGADLVLCQHSHCIGCEEVYRGSHIVYGQGNFLFDRSENLVTKEGLLVQLMLEEKPTVDFIPIVVRNGIAQIPQGEEKDRILAGFKERSEHISKPGKVEEEFELLCQGVVSNYLFAFRGGNLVAKVINKITKGTYVKGIYKPRKALQILNNIQCESLLEVSIRTLEIMTRNKE